MSQTTRPPPTLRQKRSHEKLEILGAFSHLSQEENDTLKYPSISTDYAAGKDDSISKYIQPIGIASNFKINNTEYLIPFVSQEVSSTAMTNILSQSAKVAKVRGGFSSLVSGSTIRGQMIVINTNVETAMEHLEIHKQKLMDTANIVHQTLRRMQKGVMDITWREVIPRNDSSQKTPYLVIELRVDVGDNMPNQIIPSIFEKIHPMIETITKGNVLLSSTSDYTTERTVTVFATFDRTMTGGDRVVDRILAAYELAEQDPYRAINHNKDIITGIRGVAMATGQDTVALEAAAHVYACRYNTYRTLSTWTKNESGHLVGIVDIPMGVGIVDDDSTPHPIARPCTNMLKLGDSDDLAGVIGAVGLAYHYACLREAVKEQG